VVQFLLAHHVLLSSYLRATGLHVRYRRIAGETSGAPDAVVVITTHLCLISWLNYVCRELSLCCVSVVSIDSSPNRLTRRFLGAV